MKDASSVFNICSTCVQHLFSYVHRLCSYTNVSNVSIHLQLLYKYAVLPYVECTQVYPLMMVSEHPLILPLDDLPDPWTSSAAKVWQNGGDSASSLQERLYRSHTSRD